MGELLMALSLAEVLLAVLELDDLGVFPPGEDGASEMSQWVLERLTPEGGAAE